MFQHKNNAFLVYKLFILFVAFAACKKENTFKYPSRPYVTINASDSRLNGNLIHFVKDTVYVIATNIIIDSGKVFQLDAGTIVKVNPLNYITIQPGARIEANGTLKEPIVFTSNAGMGKAGFSISVGTWDGIRISGNTNGKSSGILNYVRIEFAGVYESSLLLSGISKTTTLNNIQVSYSFNEPSFKFTGGSCNASNLVSYASGGTDFYISNGYKGNMQNLLAYRYPSFATSGANLAGVDIEGAGTFPSISNLTVIGPSSQHGINFEYFTGVPNRRAAVITTGGSKFHIRNSVFIGYPKKAYYLDNTNTAVSLQSGESDFAYSVINPIDTSNAFYLADNVYPPYNSNDLKSFLLQTKFHNQIINNTDQLQLTNPYNYFDGIPDPLPKAGSPLLTGADFNDSINIFKNPFFKPVPYRGALGTDNWLQGWVNFIPLQTDYYN
jgi:hypothetical protein